MKLLTKTLILLLLIFCSQISYSQIPKRAKEIADSIVKTRVYCSNTIIQLEDSIFYPVFKNQYQDRKTESYYFSYKVTLNNNVVTELNISIEENFSIKYIGAMPDKNYPFSPCLIMEREQLWQIAKNKGLRTKFKKCKYYLLFEEDGLFIRFLENKSRYNWDHYTINAITGEYIGHTKANVNF